MFDICIVIPYHALQIHDSDSSMVENSPPTSPSHLVPQSSEEEDSGWESHSSDDSDSGNSNVHIDFVGPGVTFSTS